MAFIQTIELSLGLEAKKKYLLMQNVDEDATYADIDALVNTVSFQPNTPLNERIARWPDWYKGYAEIWV